jgi:cyclopropane fatty-acyl-phospholipid synthase-like methyltransferase
MDWNITDSEKLEDIIFKMKLALAQKIGVCKGMTVVDMGCGQGGFTASLAKTVGKKGKVIAVDVSNEYLTEFTDRLNKHGVKDIVTFIQADAVNLRDILPNESAHLVASYRFLEELKQPEIMTEIVKEMARIVRHGGKIGIVELCTKPRNEAEEAYIRLHKESGDSLFEPHEIVHAMKAAKLADVQVKEVKTNIWISPDLAKQDLSHAQIWFDADVEKRLGKLIDRYGMKYPALLIFSSVKNYL